MGNRLKQLGSWIIAAGAVLGVFGVAGCVSTKPAVKPHATVLFSVVLRGEFVGDRQPTGLIVTVDNGDAIEGKQFAFNPSTRIPGHYTSFLVRLDWTQGLQCVWKMVALSVPPVIAIGIIIRRGAPTDRQGRARLARDRGRRPL